ncbi:MAG: Fic family protein [Nanoarchaeota archaeon]|nr:Fic family protein [Nanoarchaeota archaeon]
MVTKYDVFARIIENAPCKISSLKFQVPVYNHIKELQKENLVEKNNNLLVPIKSEKSEIIFKIIKWSLKNGFDFNLWFRKNTLEIIKKLSENNLKINSKTLSNNYSNLEIINFLIENQFILLQKKKPKLGTLLNNNIFELLKKYNKKEFKIEENFLNFEEISKLILKGKSQIVNPFENKIFEFLAGSAQLEGSTVTIGETIDLIIKNIYPNKPIEDIQMVKNLNLAFDYMYENYNKELTIEKIKQINEKCLITLHKGGGIFKKNQNKIQGNPNFKVAHPSEVFKKLERFCKIFNQIKSKKEVLEKIGFLHNEFQHIHPFIDGNSRTTRILINWLILKFNLPLIILKKGSFEKYMNLTKLSKKRNDDFLRDFLLHILYHESLIKDL